MVQEEEHEAEVVELSGLRAYQAECAFVAPKTHFN